MKSRWSLEGGGFVLGLVALEEEEDGVWYFCYSGPSGLMRTTGHSQALSRLCGFHGAQHRARCWRMSTSEILSGL